MKNEDKEIFCLSQTNMDENETEEENYKDSLKLISYFSKLIKKDKLENIDEKLFEMLEPKYKKIIAEEVSV